MATSASDPSVAAPARFAQRLTVRQHPAPALQRLGHDVRIDAPSGRALDVARTTTSAVRNDVPALPAVQRRGRPGALDLGLPDVITAAALSAPEPEELPSVAAPATAASPAASDTPSTSSVSRPAAGASAVTTSAVTTSAAPAPISVARAPIAASAAPMTTSAAPAPTSTGSLTTPLPVARVLGTVTGAAATPVVGRVPLSDATRTVSPMPASAPLPNLPVARAVTGAAAAPSIGSAASAPALISAAGPAIGPSTISAAHEAATSLGDIPSLSTSAEQSSADAVSSTNPAPLVGDSPLQRSGGPLVSGDGGAAAPRPRAGLGAPISAIPRRVQRTRLDDPVTLPEPGSGGGDWSAPDVTAPVRLAPATAAALPVLPGSAATTAPVAVARSAATASAPLVGATTLSAAVPLVTVLGGTTDTDAGADTWRADGAAEDSAPRQPTVGGVPLPAHLAALVPTSSAAETSGAVQRSVAPSTITPVAPPATMTAAPTPTYAAPLRQLPAGGPRAIARTASSSPPSSGSVSARGGTAIASRPVATSAMSTTRAALASGIGSLASDGSVTFAPPLVAQRSVEGTESFASESGAVTESTGYPAEAAASSSSAPTAASESVGGLASMPAAGGGAAPAAGPDLDRLAEDLYERVRPMLTRELLLDRERSGTLMDL